MTSTTKPSAYHTTTAREGWTRANALRIRARAWTGYPVGAVLVHVRPDGTVCAWDSVACHWTSCHSLSPRAIAKARALAAA